MSRSRYDHEHNYVAVGSKFIQFKCSVPGCPHLISAVLAVGRMAKCPHCSCKFQVTAAHLRNKTVHCGECKKALKKLAITVVGKTTNLLEDTLSAIRGKPKVVEQTKEEVPPIA